MIMLQKFINFKTSVVNKAMMSPYCNPKNKSAADILENRINFKPTQDVH